MESGFTLLKAAGRLRQFESHLGHIQIALYLLNVRRTDARTEPNASQLHESNLALHQLTATQNQLIPSRRLATAANMHYDAVLPMTT